MEAVFSEKLFQLKVILWLLTACWVVAQDEDIVRTCTDYKTSLFVETQEFSLLYEGAPIIRKTRDKCKAYAPVIIGGAPAIPKEFPHAARLGHRDDEGKVNWFCGGTLISNRHILTAAHCVLSFEGTINIVRLGELEFDNNKDDAQPEDFGVQSRIVHPGYDHPVIYDDIAILKLDRNVTFNEYKHPACLPFTDGRKSSSFIAIGWGQTALVPRRGSESSKILKKVKLFNFNTRCKLTAEINEELPNGYNASSQICIGSHESSQDTCNGDSGGPVLTIHKQYPCMYHVEGITSVAVACDTPDFPGMYTRVHYYLDWIKKEMAKP